MKWDEFVGRNNIQNVTWEQRTMTDIECPRCNRKIWRRNDITLTSLPPKYQYECQCGWVGYAAK